MYSFFSVEKMKKTLTVILLAVLTITFITSSNAFVSTTQCSSPTEEESAGTPAYTIGDTYSGYPAMLTDAKSSVADNIIFVIGVYLTNPNGTSV